VQYFYRSDNLGGEQRVGPFDSEREAWAFAIEYMGHLEAREAGQDPQVETATEPPPFCLSPENYCAEMLAMDEDWHEHTDTVPYSVWVQRHDLAAKWAAEGGATDGR
jgi:hypothetical protein